MEFHLIYQGKLHAASQSNPRTREKHEIRKEFHKQLSILWATQPFLKEGAVQAGNRPTPTTELMEMLGDRFSRCGYRFVPLVCKFFSVACSLDILLLRRDGPGAIIRSGGDIDNRVKLLFDALRMPQNCGELAGESPANDENPFFCLLEDDSLITKVRVETNWLLSPPSPQEHINDVHLVIRVKTVVAGSKRYEAAFHY